MSEAAIELFHTQNIIAFTVALTLHPLFVNCINVQYSTRVTSTTPCFPPRVLLHKESIYPTTVYTCRLGMVAS